MIRATTIVLLILAAGCLRQPTPVEVAQAHIQSWRSMGMYLPKDQVPFFAANFTEVAGALSNALCDPNDDVRQRAAYVIEELGIVAAPLEDDVVAAILSESNRLVRLYLYNAIRATGQADHTAVRVLRRRFMALPKTDTDVKADPTYSAIDERIYVASALYVLDPDEEGKGKYLAEVTQWLRPPDTTLSKPELEDYWEHRWCAVNAVENMKGAREAIPLLEAMLVEKSGKPWVSVHVPRAINTLKKDRNSQPAHLAD